MLSAGIGFGDRSAVTFEDTADHLLLDQVVQEQTARDVLVAAQAEIAIVAAAVARAAREVADLWCDSLATENSPLSERLVEVSRALWRARLMLEQDGVIVPGPEYIG